MKTIQVAELQHNVIHYLEMAIEEDILILKEGKPIGVLHSLIDEDDLFDYHIESHPVFMERIAQARKELREGKSERLDDVRDALLNPSENE